MKPKLIILDGPLGIGKSTLAQRYADDHPATLNLDIDHVWSMLSHWREQKDITGPLSKEIAIEMGRVCLSAKHDVIVPQIIQTLELANSFQRLAVDTGASFYHVQLLVDKEEAIRRFVVRGQSQGYETGFRPGGVIDKGGRENKLAAMYDNMIATSEKRTEIIKIAPKLGDIEATYTELLGVLGD